MFARASWSTRTGLLPCICLVYPWILKIEIWLQEYDMIHGAAQAVRNTRIPMMVNFQPRRHPHFSSDLLTTTKGHTDFQSSLTPSLAPRHGAVKGDQHPRRWVVSVTSVTARSHNVELGLLEVNNKLSPLILFSPFELQTARRNYRQNSVSHRKKWRLLHVILHVWQKNPLVMMLVPWAVCAVAENAVARQSWPLLRVRDELEKGLAQWKQLRWMVNLGQRVVMIVNNKSRTSEALPTEGCLCVHSQTLMVILEGFYTQRTLLS